MTNVLGNKISDAAGAIKVQADRIMVEAQTIAAAAVLTPAQRALDALAIARAIELGYVKAGSAPVPTPTPAPVPTPTPTPTPTPASTFAWIDGTAFARKPGEIKQGNVYRSGCMPGMQRLEYVYQQTIWGRGFPETPTDPELPPVANLRAAVDTAIQFDQRLMCLDIENYWTWPWSDDKDGKPFPDAHYQQNIANICWIVKQVKDYAASKNWPLRVGVYGLVPLGLMDQYLNPNASPAMTAQTSVMPAHQGMMMPLVELVDYLTPTLYLQGTDMVEWDRWVSLIVAEARRLIAKRTGGPIPVYGHLWERYFVGGGGPRTPGIAMDDLIPVGDYTHALGTIRARCDGLIAWGGNRMVPVQGDPLNGQRILDTAEPWYSALQAEIAKR